MDTDSLTADLGSTAIAENVGDVAAILHREFGVPRLGNKRNPFCELLYIILSSRTPPETYQDGYRDLRRRFPTADSLAEATPEEVAECIGRGGLQNKKALAITEIATELKRRFGRVTLAPLRRMNTQDAERFLTTLSGVSVKTARCVLMYALDVPVFPVDVHCWRIARRLGWVAGRDSPTKRGADELQAMIPEPLRHDLHVGMVLLGRRYCRPKNPECLRCPLCKFCGIGRQRSSDVGG